MEFIYHYTSEIHLKKILETGELKTSEYERKNKIKPPALWLSLNPVWENTATKLVKTKSGVRQLTKEEQNNLFGLIRFVLKFDEGKLCSWAKYRHVSNTPINVYLQMERAGVKKGANPKEWYACFKNIPLKHCIYCQKWSGREWETIIDFKDYKK